MHTVCAAMIALGLTLVHISTLVKSGLVEMLAKGVGVFMIVLAIVLAIMIGG